MTSSFKLMVPREFLLLKVLMVLIYLLLEVYYNCWISSQYDYMGFVWDLNILNYVLTKIVFISLLALSRA